MATIADELNAISVEHGYTGAAPKTIADAIDALADTLAGEDVSSGRSIAGAIHALAPYIGTGGGEGGGGAELGAGYELTVTGTAYNILASDQPITLGDQGPEGIKLYMQCRKYNPSDMKPLMPSGMHVVLFAVNQSQPTYTVQGVEYEVFDNEYGGIQFVMPENAVSIDIVSHGALG